MSLFDGSTFFAFLLAAVALVIAPGPGQALVLARTLQGGTRSGVLTAAGLEIGTFVHTLAASVGLSAVLMTSATAFTVVKFVGAGYLVLLGVMTLRRAGRVAAPVEGAAPAAVPDSRLLLHAALTGTLNPKVALFFLAFLPQFVDPARGQPLLQFLILGLTFAVLGFVGDSAVALLADGARHRLREAPAWAIWRERVTGAVLVGLGLRLALLSRR
jgi:threonine/homoserine/homoserine lactone efflux protein